MFPAVEPWFVHTQFGRMVHLSSHIAIQCAQRLLLRMPMAWKTISSSACAPLGTAVIWCGSVPYIEFTESHDLGMLWSPRRIRRDATIGYDLDCELGSPIESSSWGQVVWWSVMFRSQWTHGQPGSQPYPAMFNLGKSGILHWQQNRHFHAFSGSNL